MRDAMRIPVRSSLVRDTKMFWNRPSKAAGGGGEGGEGCSRPKVLDVAELPIPNCRRAANPYGVVRFGGQYAEPDNDARITHGGWNRLLLPLADVRVCRVRGGDVEGEIKRV